MSVRRVLLVLFLAALVVITLAACAQGATPSPSQPPPSTPLPPATPTSPNETGVSGGTHYYDCAELLSDAEMQQATGLPDASLFGGTEKSEEEGGVPGTTYCQFVAEQGAISFAVSVFTGPSYEQVFQPLTVAFTAGAGATIIPGLGDEAWWSDQIDALAIRVGSIGITVFFVTEGDLSDIGDLQRAAEAIGRFVVSRL